MSYVTNQFDRVIDENNKVKVSKEVINHPLVVLGEGSYFGEISYIFQIKNKYNYSIKRESY